MVVQYGVELDGDRHRMMVRERELEYASTEIHCPHDAVELLQTVFHAGSQAEEHMYLISLDARKKVLGVFDVCHGQAASCMVSPREIFLRVLISGGSSAIAAHNHPSGHVTPSTEDSELTKRLREAGLLLGIQLDDSLILSSDGTYYSFMEAGQMV